MRALSEIEADLRELAGLQEEANHLRNLYVDLRSSVQFVLGLANGPRGVSEHREVVDEITDAIREIASDDGADRIPPGPAPAAELKPDAISEQDVRDAIRAWERIEARLVLIEELADEWAEYYDPALRGAASRIRSVLSDPDPVDRVLSR